MQNQHMYKQKTFNNKIKKQYLVLIKIIIIAEQKTQNFQQNCQFKQLLNDVMNIICNNNKTKLSKKNGHNKIKEKSIDLYGTRDLNYCTLLIKNKNNNDLQELNQLNYYYSQNCKFSCYRCNKITQYNIQKILPIYNACNIIVKSQTMKQSQNQGFLLKKYICNKLFKNCVKYYQKAITIFFFTTKVYLLQLPDAIA
eukprot:TRINITY_DN1122_c0_g1_i16.p3 TRINITY_DN1122_c0_g1~~TRINITY_DN1122_c0_g1_i16.p3  ORF type:complete len:197 (-),score=-4.06 TRINITY_DN1122_c0_g1_i16:521-1111(-)